jgi:SAM-dependent methyltransferase
MTDLSTLPERLRWTLRWQTTNLVPLLERQGVERRLREFWNATRRMGDVLDATSLDARSLSVDIGGGMTTPLRWFPGRRVCVDPLARHYDVVHDLPSSVEFVAERGEALPMTAESVDLVVCTNCIDHTEDPQRVIGEITRVLRPGGWLWFACELRPPGKLRNAGHPHALDRRALEELVSGFDVVLAWEEPWRGVYRFLRGDEPTSTTELGFLLTKPNGKGGRHGS